MFGGKIGKSVKIIVVRLTDLSCVIFRIVATAGYELVSRGQEELESLSEEATYGEKDYLGVFRQEDNSQSRTVGDHLKRNATALLLTRYTSQTTLWFTNC